MPIYEFYCKNCNTIFSFLSKTANVAKKPSCPRCRRMLEKRVSMFSFSQKQRGTEAMPFRSQQIEDGVKKLKEELGRRKDKDPRDAQQFKKKFERWAGVKLDYDVRAAAKTTDVKVEKEAAAHRAHDSDEPFIDDTIYEF